MVVHLEIIMIINTLSENGKLTINVENGQNNKNKMVKKFI